ncbi:glycosyltransferase family 2 protein [Fimbriiglobus ruber]|uniref:Glycosyl transferase, family 2 n=1 Tax=Fimbriiglobus ruber TaxID=1908690 RepID=A0A225EA91_9BACT|nr:glycosyltransferase family 2 protein [Fimbriiglobus ruber]OWK46309.1 Glycosyl transferase, family 2 [Fimbriiglobus ruber]
MSSPVLSMVIPVMNEEEVLPQTKATLTSTLDGLGIPYEVVVVDNGSSDNTPLMMADICAADSRWKFVRLSRNFGYQNSITAGMMTARGEAIMVIDSDLQDPPELIAEFVSKWRDGYEVVYGVREKRTGESLIRVWPTMMAMKFITWMSDDVKLPLNSSDFRLISRRVRDAYARLPESTRYVRGLVHWLGFKQIGIPYTRRGRLAGSSKVNWVYLIGFTFNAVFNFSVKPLRLFSFLGLSILFGTGLLMAVYAALFFFADPPRGVTTLLVLLLLNLGILSLGIGILGEYLAKIYIESKRRPLWLVDYTLNLDAAATPVSPADPATESLTVPPEMAVYRIDRPAA